ncbi:MAG TPA: acyl-CoA dehydrogenase family protein [Euzebya sp.]|nr:acyl-CoA dehydrogenase family protein [Euzebya sp.]
MPGQRRGHPGTGRRRRASTASSRRAAALRPRGTAPGSPLGDPDASPETGFAGAMQTFDNTRPLVAAMALGIADACLERTRQLVAEAGVDVDYDRPGHAQPAAAAELLAMEADSSRAPSRSSC